MKMRAFQAVMALCWLHFTRVSSYPNGEVSISCGSMLPNHGENAPQTDAAPYRILVSKSTFIPEEQITVTLRANTGPFLGFLVEARAVGGDFTVGKFAVTDSNAQLLDCNGVASTAVSHTSRAPKSTVNITWTAPSGSGYVQFRGTFVQSFNRFWTGVQSQIVVPLQITSGNCDSEKLCFRNPSECNPATSSNCFFMSSVPATGGGFVFEMSAPSDGYVAIGFSSDKIMGNDDIYMCVLNTTQQIGIQHAISTGRNSPTIRPLGVVESPVTSFNNGNIKCTFVLRSNISLPSGEASNLYYIFLATGPVSAGAIGQHTQNPFITDQMADIMATRAQVLTTSSVTLNIRVHGALMLIAWMTTGSIGMVFARYLKNAAEKPVLGKALWFQVHVLMMVLTVALTITSFVVIFVAVMGWSYTAGAHAVLGCIVMILAFLQPIIALFRPGPKDSQRFIFNWFHALNAMVIKVLAGFNLIDRSSNLWLPKVLGGFVGWEALTIVLLELNNHLKLKESNVYEFSERKVKNENIFVITYIIGNLAFLIALLVGIGQS
ncbi:putative ferric-chelate reductase 1 isoform X2 [Pleurodeles waltl]|uniref:putative ferric-chelate reductase 1 isoform X2 n=1 Tax=Pleurodeles waltl TaxID=8319 RepID=UPI0037098FCA